MNRLLLLCGLLLLLGLAAPLAADDNKADDGFVPMFDGRTLRGWINVNGHPDTWSVKDGEVITTGKPTGFLRAEKQYENFVAEFDWMHVPPQPDAVGNSGFFVWADPVPVTGSPFTRGIEVQVLVNLEYKDKKTGAVTATSHGDLFSIQGAHCVPDRPHPLGSERCLPSENRAKGAGEWNHYRVEANDGVIKLHVNGKEVSGVSKCIPRKGYLALESEGSECHFKNLRIKELPSTNPKKEEVADEDMGYKNLYTGLDLSGWKADDEAKKHWQPKDWTLHYDGKGEAKDNALRTEKGYGDCGLRADFKFPAKEAAPCTFVLRGTPDFEVRLTVTPKGNVSLKGVPSKASGLSEWTRSYDSRVLIVTGGWNGLIVTLKGQTLTVTVNGTAVANLKDLDLPAKGTFDLKPEGEMDFANLFVRELK